MNDNKTLLLVDDDDVDALTVTRSLKELHVTNPLARVVNGQEALDWLRDPKNELPALILLDLNMPRLNGIEFLQIAKADDTLKSIPVVVLTTSNEEKDKIQSFALSVAGYMSKPVDYREFVNMMRTIDLYWTVSKFPKR